MGPARYNLRIVRGDDFFARYRITTENPDTGARTPVNLAGWSVESRITSMADRADFPITASIPDPTNGVVQLSIADDDTALLPNRNADWYLALTNPSLIKTSYMAGDVFFLKPGGSV